jgi:hypothetical protein
MLVCLDCNTAYHQKTIKNNMCKNKECCGDIVQIDELIVPAIIELNRKGYITKYCCSGHLQEDLDTVSSYIYFEDDAILTSYPIGYIHDMDAECYTHLEWYKPNNTIRREFKGDIIEIGRQLSENAVTLIDWAKSLPSIWHE